MLHVAERQPSATTVMFEDKEVKIPSASEGYEIFILSLRKTLRTLGMVPYQIILVDDSITGKELRRKFLPGYSVRPKKAKEWSESFKDFKNRVISTVLSYGGIYVKKEGYEADDIIYALSEKLDCVIWSGDKDLLACPADLFYEDELNPNKFMGIAKNHIAVYKALVGDTSDKIPGARGFGEAAFIKLVSTFGDEGLEDIRQLLEEEKLDELAEYVSQMSELQKILDNKDTVYASYRCAKFYHPGWKLEWKMAYPLGLS